MGGMNAVDAQFGTARILRPFVGFDLSPGGAQGQRVQPIPFTENGQRYDQSSMERIAGYSPTLLAGTPVPFGARVVMYLPYFRNQNAAGAIALYRYVIDWRMRNLFDFRTQRKPYHYPSQDQGVPDTTPLTGGPRVVIPAASQTIVFNEAEPVTTGEVVNHLRTEEIEVYANVNMGFGMTSQGLIDPQVPTKIMPAFGMMVHEVQALGDEMLIGITRDTAVGSGGPNWDFSAPAAPGQFPVGVDYALSYWFGLSPVLGIYMMVGSAP